MKKFHAHFLGGGAYALILGFSALHAAETLAQESLFTYQPMRSSMPADTGPATIAEHEVTVDTWALARSERHAAEFLLPDGSRFKAVPEEIRYRGDWHTDFAWRGKLEGDSEQGWALITVRQGHIAGTLSLPGRNDFTLKPGPEPGVIRLLEIDGSVIPECGVEDLPEPELSGPVQPASLPPVAPASAGSAPIIDVMVVYTPLARQNAGGHAQIQAQIQAAVDITNDAYANSVIFQRVHLIHTQEVSYAGDQNGETMSQQLQWVRENSAVADLRNQYRADLVALVSETSSDFFTEGLAYIMTNPAPSFESLAFSVTKRSSLNSLVFAHELGHNLGLDHDPDNSPRYPDNGSYRWSYGHVDITACFHTVMAYRGGLGECPGGTDWIPYFSSPDISVSGRPTGIAGDRDNARTLNLTANIAANFRQGNYLYADRFEDRGYALYGSDGPPPLTHAEACTELDVQLTFYEAGLSERRERVDEDDKEAWQRYEEEVATVAQIREQMEAHCP